MKKVYIAGKITGNPNYKQQFEDAEKELLERGYAVLNPAKNPDGLSYEDYMHLGFAMIDVADGIYFMPNWQTSPGACREYDYALNCGKSKVISITIDGFKDWKGW